MKYFCLSDDVHVPDRWHLGKTFDSNDVAGMRLELWLGKKAPSAVSPCVEITHPGVALDFCLTSFAVPIAESNLADLIAAKAGSDLERLPLDIRGYEGYKEFEILNSIRVIKCLDEMKSQFIKWTKNDHRSDLAGQYRMVTKLKIDQSQIPSDAHFFRLEGWRIALIVSEQVKFAMEDSGCVGAHFEEVS